MKVEITTVRITLGSKVIELTAEEARQLHAELRELFQKSDHRDVLERFRKMVPPSTSPCPTPIYGPIHIDSAFDWPKRWEIHCQSLDGTGQQLRIH